MKIIVACYIQPYAQPYVNIIKVVNMQNPIQTCKTHRSKSEEPWKKTLEGKGGKVIVEREKIDQGTDEGQKGRKAFRWKQKLSF